MDDPRCQSRIRSVRRKCTSTQDATAGTQVSAVAPSASTEPNYTEAFAAAWRRPLLLVWCMFGSRSIRWGDVNISVTSARHTNPGAELRLYLPSEDAPGVPSDLYHLVVEVKQLPTPTTCWVVKLASLQLAAMQDAPGRRLILLEGDQFITGPLETAFANYRPFDVGLTFREGTQAAAYGPINSGTMFFLVSARVLRFFRYYVQATAQWIRKLKDGACASGANQEVLAGLVGGKFVPYNQLVVRPSMPIALPAWVPEASRWTGDTAAISLVSLPCEIYNRKAEPPRCQFPSVNSTPAVVVFHFVGSYAKRLLSRCEWAVSAYARGVARRSSR